jgi:hypothetical protein
MQNSNHETSYETSDINLKMVAFYTVTGVIILVIILIFLNEFFIASRESQVRERILSVESTELRELRAKEQETLHTYQVLDKEQNRYQIPIDRAMELLADEAFQKRLESEQ